MSGRTTPQNWDSPGASKSPGPRSLPGTPLPFPTTTPPPDVDLSRRISSPGLRSRSSPAAQTPPPDRTTPRRMPTPAGRSSSFGGPSDISLEDRATPTRRVSAATPPLPRPPSQGRSSRTGTNTTDMVNSPSTPPLTPKRKLLIHEDTDYDTNDDDSGWRHVSGSEASPRQGSFLSSKRNSLTRGDNKRYSSRLSHSTDGEGHVLPGERMRAASDELYYGNTIASLPPIAAAEGWSGSPGPSPLGRSRGYTDELSESDGGDEGRGVQAADAGLCEYVMVNSMVPGACMRREKKLYRNLNLCYGLIWLLLVNVGVVLVGFLILGSLAQDCSSRDQCLGACLKEKGADCSEFTGALKWSGGEARLFQYRNVRETNAWAVCSQSSPLDFYKTPPKDIVCIMPCLWDFQDENYGDGLSASDFVSCQAKREGAVGKVLLCTFPDCQTSGFTTLQVMTAMAGVALVSIFIFRGLLKIGSIAGTLLEERSLGEMACALGLLFVVAAVDVYGTLFIWFYQDVDIGSWLAMTLYCCLLSLCGTYPVTIIQYFVEVWYAGGKEGLVGRLQEASDAPGSVRALQDGLAAMVARAGPWGEKAKQWVQGRAGKVPLPKVAARSGKRSKKKYAKLNRRDTDASGVSGLGLEEDSDDDDGESETESTEDPSLHLPR